MPSDCPPCDIIIIDYADIPADCSVIQWKCQAIEALYDKPFVQARLKAHPGMHEEIIAKLVAMHTREQSEIAILSGIIKDLTGSPLADL